MSKMTCGGADVFRHFCAEGGPRRSKTFSHRTPSLRYSEVSSLRGLQRESREDSEVTRYLSANSHFDEESVESPTMEIMPLDVEHSADPRQLTKLNGSPFHVAKASNWLRNSLKNRPSNEATNDSAKEDGDLQEGQIFAKRYLLEQGNLFGHLNCRCAVDTFTGESVFLKFFPDMQHEFENSVKMHMRLSSSPYICRLLDTIVNERGYPPCLVLERGDYTLSERLSRNPLSMIRRISVLYEILEGIEEIHSQGVTHGSLTPSNIMWFSTECTWKLIDLKCASSIKDWTLVTDAMGKYAAPEIRYAERLSRQRIHLDPEADMWSFGVIALETLTGRTFLDSGSLQRCIADWVWASNLDAEHDNRWLFADPNGRHAGSDEERYIRFVRQLLRRSPKHRMTAADALGDVLFRNVEDASQRSNALDQTSYSAVQTDPFLRSLVGAQLRIKATVETFSDRNQSAEPFYLRKGYRAYTEDDEELEVEPIYILRLGESFRLRLIISYAEGCQLPIHDIESISLKTLNGENITLEQRIVRVDSVELEAVVPMNPSVDSLRELFAVRPMFGTVNERYTKTTLQLKFRLGVNPDSTMVKNCELYFLIVRSDRKLRRHRLERKIRHRWQQLPKPVKQGIRLLYSCVWTAAECAMPF